jgi:hypothetical protein
MIPFIAPAGHRRIQGGRTAEAGVIQRVEEEHKIQELSMS